MDVKCICCTLSPEVKSILTWRRLYYEPKNPSYIYYCTDLSIQSNADDVFHNYFTYNTIGCLNYILCSWACVIFCRPHIPSFSFNTDIFSRVQWNTVGPGTKRAEGAPQHTYPFMTFAKRPSERLNIRRTSFNVQGMFYVSGMASLGRTIFNRCIECKLRMLSKVGRMERVLIVFFFLCTIHFPPFCPLSFLRPCKVR